MQFPYFTPFIFPSTCLERKKRGTKWLSLSLSRVFSLAPSRVHSLSLSFNPPSPPPPLSISQPITAFYDREGSQRSTFQLYFTLLYLSRLHFILLTVNFENSENTKTQNSHKIYNPQKSTPQKSTPYGVATVSRLLKMTGPFCKRALWKRWYSAKETSNFKEPTNRSHPIPSELCAMTISGGVFYFCECRAGADLLQRIQTLKKCERSQHLYRIMCDDYGADDLRVPHTQHTHTRARTHTHTHTCKCRLAAEDWTLSEFSKFSSFSVSSQKIDLHIWKGPIKETLLFDITLKLLRSMRRFVERRRFWQPAPSHIEATAPQKTGTSSATRSITLKHTVTHCNTLQHTATHCNTLHHNVLHYSETHCNAL